jgi:DNA modification methylase
MELAELHNTDCLAWLADRAPNSLPAVCTDPPYGLVEFSTAEIAKLRSGKGGIWRIPPEFDGKKRNPLPRFSILTTEQRNALGIYFRQWGELLLPALVPGAHILVATNPVLHPHVSQGLLEAGLEPRGALMRIYHGFRGGDRPKNAETEFPDFCVSPRGNYEPWLLFRKPISEKTVAQNLRKWGFGALRMLEGGRPIPDVIPSAKTPAQEKEIADHPSLKPQQLLRFFCRMLMPNPGVLLDPFMGSGSASCQSFAMEENFITKLGGISLSHNPRNASKPANASNGSPNNNTGRLMAMIE